LTVALADTLRTWFALSPRTITPSQLFSTGQDGWYEMEAASGVAVTVAKAMQSAIGACVRLLADDISTLPIDAFRKVGEDSVPLPLPEWLERPTGRMWDTPANLISDTVVSLGSDGNAFLLCTPNVFDVQRVEVLDPSKVDIKEENGRLVYRLEGGKDAGEERVVHIPWMRLPGQLRGINVVQASKDSSGLELAAREWAGAFFRNGATLGGVIEFPQGTPKPTPEEADELRKSFAVKHQGRRKSHVMGILFGGAQYDPTSLKPAEAELGPLWQHVLEEAARIYHIPPHLLASQNPGGSSFSSVEQRSIEYVIHAVRSFVVRIERPLSRLLPGDDTFVRINVNGLLRGDFKTRAEAYRVLMESRVLTKEKVRALEDLPQDDAEVGYLDTQNNRARDPRTEDVAALIRAGFDPAASLVVVGLPPITHTGALPVTVQAEQETPAAPPDEEPARSLVPELHIDSVAVSEAGVERIAEASTTGIVAGIAVLGDALSQDNRGLAETFTDSMTRVVASLEHLTAEQAALRDRVAEAEEREERRSQPLEFFIEKDAQGRTSHIIEKRGASVVRKRIERDETGAVLSITAA
jgi:HK97 family phage portal protein